MTDIAIEMIESFENDTICTSNKSDAKIVKLLLQPALTQKKANLLARIVAQKSRGKDKAFIDHILDSLKSKGSKK